MDIARTSVIKMVSSALRSTKPISFEVIIAIVESADILLESGWEKEVE